MRLLVDSHVALWWLGDDPSLGATCVEALTDADEVHFSAVTPWELGIERALGKVTFPAGLADVLHNSGFVELPVSADHAERAVELPDHHRDPFDRMLVAQAQLEDLVLVTADRALDAYDIDRLHART